MARAVRGCRRRAARQDQLRTAFRRQRGRAVQPGHACARLAG